MFLNYFMIFHCPESLAWLEIRIFLGFHIYKLNCTLFLIALYLFTIQNYLLEMDSYGNWINKFDLLVTAYSRMVYTHIHMYTHTLYRWPGQGIKEMYVPGSLTLQNSNILSICRNYVQRYPKATRNGIGGHLSSNCCRVLTPDLDTREFDFLKSNTTPGDT